MNKKYIVDDTESPQKEATSHMRSFINVITDFNEQ